MTPTDAFIDAIVAGVTAKMTAQNGAWPRMMSIETAARYLDMTEIALRHKVKNGKLPVITLDRNFRFDRLDLDAMIEANKKQPAA